MKKDMEAMGSAYAKTIDGVCGPNKAKGQCRKIDADTKSCLYFGAAGADQ